MPGAPAIVVVGGPNGAGKSTVAKAVLDHTMGLSEFVNAAAIAAGLSAFQPDGAASWIRFRGCGQAPK